MNWLELENKVVIVTGGASGIGKHVVDCLTKVGAKAVIVDMNVKTGDEIDGAYCVQCNVADADSVQAMVDAVIEKYGEIDALVNNAGINLPRLLVDVAGEKPEYELNDDSFNKMFAVNVKGVFLCAQACAKQMLKQGKGIILNMSSESGKEGSQGQSAYSATKGAVDSFTRSWAKELGKYNIRVLAAAPGIMEATGLRTPAYREFYLSQQKRAAEFAEQVHNGEIVNERGETYSTVVQIGIGGSDLGPRAIYLALENWAKATNNLKMDAKFISNVDPDDAAAVLNSVDLSRTLFILVTKSGTTLETLTNGQFVKDALVKAELDPAKHMLAVTSETSPLAKSDEYMKAIFMDDFIGGRFSSSSAVGGVVRSLAFGPEIFARILAGAAAADDLAKNEDIYQNAALLDALIGVYERNIQGYPATAILPYSQALSRFPAHLQQADMESNGKSVNRFGESVNYVTGPVIFGEPGTNGQHSFYQLLHQGTDMVPLQFIGFKQSQIGMDVMIEGSNSQQKLCANVVAQIVAFACGKDDEDNNKVFAGSRPSSIIIGDQLTPESMGALLAHYENKIMFQGFLWNVNSFDQKGVQLGKLLAKKVLAHDTDGALKGYSDLMNI